jgi:hypothetical protein
VTRYFIVATEAESSARLAKGKSRLLEVIFVQVIIVQRNVGETHPAA